MTAALLAGLAACAGAPPVAAQYAPRQVVTLTVLPSGTSVQEIAHAGLSPGVLSAGIGEVSPEQTFLDISQGNRVSDAVYDRDLPPLRPFGEEVPDWSTIVARASAAPADLVPGLLADSIRDRGGRLWAPDSLISPALALVDRGGHVPRSRPPKSPALPWILRIVPASLPQLPALARSLRPEGMLIALTMPSPGDHGAMPIGIAGPGFDGNLTSDSTRTPGYVLSTDLAPTIVERFDPGGWYLEGGGEPIRTEGQVDPRAVENLAQRMAAIPDRRAPVLIACLAVWVLLGIGVNRVVFGLRRVAIAWLALCFAYMPLMLLAGAWLESSAVVEGLLIALGSAVLAALTVRFAWGWRGLAIASAITVIAYTIDVIAGSGLTRLSLLGPNPIYGTRFYGIGNELEALFAVMVPVAVGAALTARWRSGAPVTDGQATAAFLGTAVLGAAVFGAGRFGADVGAAIVLPVGGAVAAAFLPRAEISERALAPWRRVILIVIAVPIVALAALAVIDLISGGNAHLTRSVIDAGGATNFSEVVDRRLRLSAHDFAQAAGNPLFWIVVVGIVVAVSQRRRIDAWLNPAPIARAGLIGACAAIAVGMLVNDSGATFLVLGGLALGAFLAYAWSQAGEIATQGREIRSSPRNT